MNDFEVKEMSKKLYELAEQVDGEKNMEKH